MIKAFGYGDTSCFAFACGQAISDLVSEYTCIEYQKLRLRGQANKSCHWPHCSLMSSRSGERCCTDIKNICITMIFMRVLLSIESCNQ